MPGIVRKTLLYTVLRLIAATATAQILPGYNDIDSLKHRLKQLPLQNIEGLYTFPKNNTVLAIERDNPEATRFRLVAVSSPFLLLEPGQLLGYAYPTTQRNTFDAQLTQINANGTNRNHSTRKLRPFTLTLNNSDAIEFKPVKKGLKISWDWWRLFPYLFRFRVNNVDTRPQDLDGALRLWPPSPDIPPRQPRYL